MKATCTQTSRAIYSTPIGLLHSLKSLPSESLSLYSVYWSRCLPPPAILSRVRRRGDDNTYEHISSPADRVFFGRMIAWLPGSLADERIALKELVRHRALMCADNRQAVTVSAAGDLEVKQSRYCFPNKHQ